MARILLIDDNPGFLLSAQEYFSARCVDVKVETASSAEAGLLFMSAYYYDVVISDFSMPGLDGLTLIKECKRLHPHTPIILISGYGDADLQATALLNGA